LTNTGWGRFFVTKHTTIAVYVAIFVMQSNFSLAAKTKPEQNTQQLRADYINRVQQESPATQETATLGSLYVPNGLLTDLASDYKARRVGDVVTLIVQEQTAASSSGDVNNQRTFQVNSAITGAAAGLKAATNTNPLVTAQSSKQLKGQGETSADSSVTATVSARVIALLANGNMVVEAERKTLINSQHEDLIVRGVLRPGDVGPGNTAPATALANLEIELKGKGVVSDYIGRQNPLIRGLLWLLTW
jgi:flagellar L-ring protein FlgH